LVEYDFWRKTIFVIPVVKKKYTISRVVLVLLQGISQMSAEHNWSVTVINISCPLFIDRGPTKFILILLNQLSRTGRNYIKEPELDMMSGSP